MKNLTFINGEFLREIFLNLKAHKLRTILTSFGISWGVFLLVILLGISGGVQQGVTGLFSGFTKKTIWFYGGSSNHKIAYRKSGRDIRFDLEDITHIKNNIPNVASVSTEVIKTPTPVFYENEKGWFKIIAINEYLFDLKSLEIGQGRKFNSKDIEEKKNVIIIGERIVQRFFKKSDPLGKSLQIGNQNFTIIGVLDKKSFFSVNERNSIFVPLTTFSETVMKVDHLPSLAVTISNVSSKSVITKIKSFLARKYHFRLEENGSLYIVNHEEQMSAFDKFFKGFNIFLLFVGCCLLLSGIIGVTNVMYIIVKERTNEIGIKKAIGAAPAQILKEFILEATILTVISGLTGLLLGIIALKGIDLAILKLIKNDQIITKTILDIKYLILTTILLVVSGILAGFFPARKASGIKPVEAMRSL